MFDFISTSALFGLAAAACWGFGDFLGAKVARTLGGLKAALLINITEALIYGAMFLLFLHVGSSFTTQGMIYALIGSLSFGFAQAMFYRAMAIGPVGLVSAISSTYPLVALFVGALLFGVLVSGIQFLGIVLVVVGVMFASGLISNTPAKLGRGPLMAMLPALGWGVGAGFIIQAIGQMGWQSALLIELLAAPFVLIALSPFIKGKEVITVKAVLEGVSWPLVIGTAILQMSGLLLLNVGLSLSVALAPIVVAVSSCYPVLVIFLALRHFNEKLPLIPLLGGVAGIIGVIILSLGS